MRKIYCYSAGPDLFPRTRADGTVETWEEAGARVRAANSVIEKHPEFKVITPTNADLANFPRHQQARVCLRKDLYLASQCEITFANVSPFGGREPDSGTVVEAVTAALAGNLLVLWSDPPLTYAEKYADADVHPESHLDDTHNLMLEQLFYWSWEKHFGEPHDCFSSLEAAASETAYMVRTRGLKHAILFDMAMSATDVPDMVKTVKPLLSAQSFS